MLAWRLADPCALSSARVAPNRPQDCLRPTRGASLAKTCRRRLTRNGAAGMRSTRSAGLEDRLETASVTETVFQPAGIHTSTPSSPPWTEHRGGAEERALSGMCL